MRRSLFIVALTLAFTMPQMLQAAGDAKKMEPSAEAVTYNTKVAKVLDINHEKNTVSLEGEAGARFDLKVDPIKVKNFKQIKKGDLVVVQTMDSMALSLEKAKKGEKPSMEEVTVTSTAPLGSMPEAQQVETKQVTAEVVKVDKEKSMVELKGPMGNVLALKVKEPQKLENVKKGDLVTATYTTAMAISVEKSPK